MGYIKTKNIGDKDMEGVKKSISKEQFDRYKSSLQNIIFTDYLYFHFYRNGSYVDKIAIGYYAATLAYTTSSSTKPKPAKVKIHNRFLQLHAPFLQY